MDNQDMLLRLMREVRRRLQNSPACHGWDHTLRVLANTRVLLAEETADRVVAEAAAVLHDVGRADEMSSRGKTCHAELGASLSNDILRQLGVVDEAFISHVAACVRTHRYRARSDEKPASIEARIVYDADKLDSIGAIGIGRAFHFAGRIGARVHNSRDEALNSPSYSHEDSAYREFLVKLQHVHGAMLTAAGRRLAEERHAFMTAFFDQLNREAPPLPTPE